MSDAVWIVPIVVIISAVIIGGMAWQINEAEKETAVRAPGPRRMSGWPLSNSGRVATAKRWRRFGRRYRHFARA